MSTYVAPSFGSYDHPFFGSRAMRTVATTINPTTRELQVVAGLTQANAGECHPGGTPGPQLSRRGGPGGADPEGHPNLGGDLAGRRTDARRSVHAGGEGA